MAKRILDGFVLRERIGLGSTASVWSAEDRDGRLVAVKELHPHLAADADSVGRFEREARIAAELRHPNVVQVVDWGCHEGDRWFIAFEHIDGADLRRLLQDGPLPAPAALSVAIDLLSALAAAHENAVVHRDVKPANVLLTREGTAKLADFSIARDRALPAMTMTGALVGTPAYMSPEQVWGREIDARSDLWSVGLILWEMLAGRRPHDGATSPEFLSSSGPPAAPAGAPSFFGREIVRALETAPAERHESALAFREALRAAARLDGFEPDARALADRVNAVAPRVVRLPLPRPHVVDVRRYARPLAAVAAIVLFLAAPLVIGLRLLGGPVAVEVVEVEAALVEATPLLEATPTADSTRVESRSALATALTVSAHPAGDVWVDGMYVGATPLWAFPVAPGRHNVKVRNSACDPHHMTVHAEPGRETAVALALACGVDPM